MLNTRSSLELLDEVLVAYVAIKDAEMGVWLSEIRGVLDSWIVAKSQFDHANKESSIGFNPLNMIPIHEPAHSRLIGELLNPRGSHGQGNLFLICFLRLLDVPEPESGSWYTFVESGRVDIMLWRKKPRSVILIENKSEVARDQPNQLYRYWHEHIYLKDRTLDYANRLVCRAFRVVYLPTSENRKPELHSRERPPGWDIWNPWVELPKELYELLSVPKLVKCWKNDVLEHIPQANIRLRTFLNFYDELWNP